MGAAPEHMEMQGNAGQTDVYPFFFGVQWLDTGGGRVSLGISIDAAVTNFFIALPVGMAISCFRQHRSRLYKNRSFETGEKGQLKGWASLPR